MSCETVFQHTEGCLPVSGEDAVLIKEDLLEEGDAECIPLQTVAVTLPGEGEHELMGVHFVVRTDDGTSWYKDATNGNSNFRATWGAGGKSSDELTDTITRAEVGSSWWTLMHRFNLASSLIDSAKLEGKGGLAAAAKIYVWLRYSSQRHLTWWGQNVGGGYPLIPFCSTRVWENH